MFNLIDQLEKEKIMHMDAFPLIHTWCENANERGVHMQLVAPGKATGEAGFGA